MIDMAIVKLTGPKIRLIVSIQANPEDMQTVPIGMIAILNCKGDSRNSV